MDTLLWLVAASQTGFAYVVNSSLDGRYLYSIDKSIKRGEGDVLYSTKEWVYWKWSDLLDVQSSKLSRILAGRFTQM